MLHTAGGGRVIRVVVQHAPNLFAILGLFDPELPATLTMNGKTFYRAEVKDHYVLYRAALSGWGAAAPNPGDDRPVFAPGQR